MYCRHSPCFIPVTGGRGVRMRRSARSSGPSESLLTLSCASRTARAFCAAARVDASSCAFSGLDSSSGGSESSPLSATVLTRSDSLKSKKIEASGNATRPGPCATRPPADEQRSIGVAHLERGARAVDCRSFGSRSPSCPADPPPPLSVFVHAPTWTRDKESVGTKAGHVGAL